MISVSGIKSQKVSQGCYTVKRGSPVVDDGQDLYQVSESKIDNSQAVSVINLVLILRMFIGSISGRSVFMI